MLIKAHNLSDRKHEQLNICCFRLSMKPEGYRFFYFPGGLATLLPSPTFLFLTAADKAQGASSPADQLHTEHQHFPPKKTPITIASLARHRGTKKRINMSSCRVLQGVSFVRRSPSNKLILEAPGEQTACPTLEATFN